MSRRIIVITVLLAACGGGFVNDEAPEPIVTSGQAGVGNGSSTVEAQPPASAAAEQTSEQPGEAEAAESDESSDIAPEDSTKPTPTTRPSSAAPADTVPDEEAPAVTGEVPEALINQVFDHAEGHTNSARSAMTVVTAEAVTWSDGSLGCPEPGMNYTQALVDGYWVKLSVGDAMLDYRLSANGGMKLCESGGLPPLPSQDT